MRVKRFALAVGILGIVFVGISFSLEWIVTKLIVSQGESHFKAKVAVKDVTIRLRDGVLVIQSLSVGDSQQAMKNRFELAELTIDLQWLPLLKKRLIIDTIAVSGLALNTDRTDSGFLTQNEHSSPMLKEAGSSTFFSFKDVIPKINVESYLKTPKIDDVIDFDQTALAKQVNDIEQLFSGNAPAITVTIEPETIQESIDQLVAKASAIKISGLSSLNDINNLIAQADGIQSQIKDAEQQIRSQINGINEQYNQRLLALNGLSSVVGADLNLVKDKLKLGDLYSGNIANVFIQDIVLSRLKYVVSLIGLGVRAMKPASDSSPKPILLARQTGTTIPFNVTKTLPSLWIRTITFSAENADQQYVTGYIRNVTNQPSVLGKPTEIKLSGKNIGNISAKAHCDAILDFTTDTSRSSINVDLTDIALPAFQLASFDDGELMIRQGTVRVNSGVKIVGKELSGQSLIRVNNIRSNAHQFRGNGLTAATFTGNLVSSLRVLTAQIAVNGTVDAPQVSVKSNLDKLISDQLGFLLKLQSSKLELDIKNQLDAQVKQYQSQFSLKARDERASQLGPLEQYLSSVNGLRGKLSQLETDLKAKSVPQNLFKF